MKRQDRMEYSRREKNRTASEDIIKSAFVLIANRILTGIINALIALISFIQKW
ncbi:hypothetical protein [Staphylococcus pseudintermedius]|uniref:hypothetical protein n=1 Tax=Staphylococcus pseudintermedius TaxID=283734 RepID=UPI001455FF82|nr:hypothetical protein [Staphylococcus pseudintermedius]